MRASTLSPNPVAMAARFATITGEVSVSEVPTRMNQFLARPGLASRRKCIGFMSVSLSGMSWSIVAESSPVASRRPKSVKWRASVVSSPNRPFSALARSFWSTAGQGLDRPTCARKSAKPKPARESCQLIQGLLDR